jgi:uncharacterized protein YbjT (DUF2867 family)
MRILLAGANGFIGRYLLARLVGAEHDVIPAVRNPAAMDALLGGPVSLAVDFNRDVTPEAWLPRLVGIDAVINCAGILQGDRGQSIEAIHTEAPKALFAACEMAGVKRVIQISAISTRAETDYARTKLAADDALAASQLDWMILRPSLVYASGAYGGTALFRALAALPFFIPVIGRGDQLFQPIHVDDLAAIILSILATPQLRARVIAPVGPDRISLKDILIDLRRWLGLRPVPVLQIPQPLIAVAARIGDVVGGTINSTALRQLEFGNAGSFDDVVAATGIRPRAWRDGLLAMPAQPQDRWHARLYFVRPALRWGIAATWIVSGVAGILQRNTLAGRYSALGITLDMRAVSLSCLVDLAIGLAVLARVRWSLLAQLAVVTFYTLALTIAEPALWLDPFGPLLKNIPFVLAVLVLGAIETER